MSPVYVDDFNVSAKVPNGNRSVNDVWCHMTADTTEELLAMAATIGLNPKWIQHPGTWKEHFDVTRARKARALAAGAIPVNAYERVQAMHENWEARQAKDPS